ncbi:MAG: hypothetical protein GX414_12810 [Acidobacteria bacterium]|nr:hypothetical protein [Acidobacteriota bacterium]
MLRRVTFWVACLVVAGLPAVAPMGNRTPRPAAFPGWPATFEGCPLVRVPLTQFDRSIGANFPGRIGRFRLNGRVVLLRWLAEPSRGLHPAADCFRGSGYQVRPLPVWAAPGGSRWGCLLAVRGSKRLQIRERIIGTGGGSWTDVSSWYWAALLGSSRGPWWAVTVVEPA